MRAQHWRKLLWLLLLVGSLQAAWAEEGVAAIDKAWAKAFQAGDLDKVLDCYADDATVWFPDVSDKRGKAAIREAYANMFKENTVTSVDMRDTHYVGMGNRGAGWGLYKIVMQPRKGGDPLVLQGRFSEVGEKRGGRWVYVVDHASAEPPPPAPAATSAQ